MHPAVRTISASSPMPPSLAVPSSTPALRSGVVRVVVFGVGCGSMTYARLFTCHCTAAIPSCAVPLHLLFIRCFFTAFSMPPSVWLHPSPNCCETIPRLSLACGACVHVHIHRLARWSFPRRATRTERSFAPSTTTMASAPCANRPSHIHTPFRWLVRRHARVQRVCSSTGATWPHRRATQTGLMPSA